MLLTAPETHYSL